MHKLSNQLPDIFQPFQMGIGTPSGAEVVVHACRNYLSQENLKNQVLLKIDFSSAFNSVRRDAILFKI